jgi:hypothetical protein
MMNLSFRRARRFTAAEGTPGFRMAFPLPRRIRQPAIVLEPIQLFAVEEVLVAGSSPAGLEQLLFDKASNARRGAVTEVLGSLRYRERPMLKLRALHRHTSSANATASWPVLACRRGGSTSLDDLAPPSVGVRLCRGGSPSGSADVFFAAGRRLLT